MSSGSWTYGRLVRQAYDYWLGRDFQLQRKRVSNLLGAYAQRMGGELKRDSRGGVFPRVELTRKKTRIGLRIQPDFSSKDAFHLVLSVRSRRHDGKDNPFPILHCLSRDMLEKDVGAPWMQVASTGNETFDHRLVCRILPEGGGLALLTPQVRQGLLNAYFLATKFGSPSLGFESHSNLVRFKQSVPIHKLELDWIRQLTRIGLRVFLRIEGRVFQYLRPLPGEILRIESLRGSCRVCGEVVLARAVACRTCDTIHHHECFEFNQGCAMYACGTQDFKRVLAG